MIKTFLAITLAIGQANAANAHCFKFWYYPYPQNCQGVYSRTNYRPTRINHPNINHTDHPVVYDIPLPDMSGTWINSAETEEQIELNEDMERLKALKSISSN
jgi:hypothetical protein